ncbi:replication initiator protein A [Commensalibacter nepenthis]|uniref:Replication initiator protein A n=1 Tax=Commensalibacter nepenthis TaxID=3043872 RepID=A0ABT6QAI4_9PROT|nr:replication initiator protein A [Commensalibacter sp. TBRC 10068]MDI2113804.1 replication initiator protein A [Commensalibacter sp. TBRC 10068]
MEHPLFALKAGNTKFREYKHNNFSISIAPHSKYGMATIHDKDIWIYCISKLMQAVYEEKEISRTVHFTIYDYLITTNRGTSGQYYELAKMALERLAGTRITTNIETAQTREAHGFGLVDSWRVVEEKDGRMVRVSVTLPDWLYRSIISNQVLTISPDYFRLRKPLDRRIYELARKHCGSQKEWKIRLELLYYIERLFLVFSNSLLLIYCEYYLSHQQQLYMHRLVLLLLAWDEYYHVFLIIVELLFQSV